MNKIGKLIQPNSAFTLMKKIRQYWFLVILVTVMTVGFYGAQTLEALSDIVWLKWTIVTATMFLMAWPLEFGHLKRVASRPLAPALASSLNMVLIPILVWPFAIWMGSELGPGMIVAACTPCTLASAAVWTRRAGGDDSVSIMVTLLTNSTCFLVMPFWIMVQTGGDVDSSQLTGTIYKLFFFVVLPISIAQVVRLNRRSAKWATRNKPMLSTLAMTGILSMVFLGALKMGLRLGGDSGIGFNPMSLCTVAAILVLVHVFVFWGGIFLAERMGLPRTEQIAVGFSGSQKTLMIGLSTAISLGVSFMPIVIFHSIQLVVDTVFADRIRTHDQAAARASKNQATVE